MEKEQKRWAVWLKEHKEVIGYIWIGVIFIYAIVNGLFFTKVHVMDGTEKITQRVLDIKKMIIFFAAGAFSVAVIRWKNKLSDERQKVITLMITVLSPIITFVMLEVMFESNLFALGARNYFFNLVVISFFAVIFIALFNSSHWSLILPVILWFAFQVANLYVTDFRGTALLMSDFTLVASALSVADSYDYTISLKVLLTLMMLVDYIIIIRKLKERKYFNSVKTRAAGIVVALAYTLIFSQLVVNGVLLKSPKLTQYKPQKSYQRNGTAVTLFGSLGFLVTPEPDGYSEETLAALMSKYTTDEVTDTDAASMPNVIVIMDEAFSDYEELYHLQTNEPTLPFFKSLKENTISGNMYVSIHGGQTANTEYEFLTGNSKAFLTFGVAPYQSYLKADKAHESLTRSFKAMGYSEELAVHPYKPTGYNRTAAYSALGFDDFLTEKDFENPLRYRKFISDEADFKKLIELYEENKKTSDRPAFLFNVTMQNHSAYDELFDNMDYDITVSNEEYKDDVKLYTYCNLLKKTDDAYKMLISYFEKEEEPTIIVIFGDHQPNIKMNYDEDVPLQKYIVPFKIWANYDIGEEKIDMISPNYLGAKVMQLAGGALTGYQKFILDMYEEVPVLTYNGYIGADGKLYDVEDETSPYYDKLEEYRILQYNNLMDTKNTVKDFFYLGEE